MAKSPKVIGEALLPMSEILKQWERSDRIKFLDATGRFNSSENKKGNRDHCAVDGQPCNGVCREENGDKGECTCLTGKFVSVRETRRKRRQRKQQQEYSEE